jgi:hypothetical protein
MARGLHCQSSGSGLDCRTKIATRSHAGHMSGSEVSKKVTTIECTMSRDREGTTDRCFLADAELRLGDE